MNLTDFKIFTKKDLDHFCEINEDCEVKINQVEDLQYITIDNFLKYPEELAEFCKLFPAENKNESLKQIDFTDIKSNSPGIQQPIDEKFLKTLGRNLYKIMEEKNFCKYEYNEDMWGFYTNLFYPGMQAYNKNYLPHVDPFTYACNIFLSNAKQTGTAFYKFKGENKEYYNGSQLGRSQVEYFRFLRRIETKSPYTAGFEEWKPFDGDEDFIMYHCIPAKFNSVTIYRGNFWHGVYYKTDDPDNYRYSLVAVIR